MADSNYGEMVTELNEFAEGKLTATQALVLINRAIRYISAFYNDEFEHLLVREDSVTLDSTGVYITLPANFNKLHRVYRNSRERNLEMGETDFSIEAGEPTDLTAAPTRRIKYWRAKTGGATRYLSYWRKWLEFTSGGGDSQVVDVPGSSEAILAVAKWMKASNERNIARGEIADLKDEAISCVRRLKARDDAAYSEYSPPATDLNNDAFEYENYNLNSGGSVDNRYNPLLDEV